MANVYAKIRQLIKDCDISYVEPLSYIKHFTAENTGGSASDKIVLLYRRGCTSTPPRQTIQREVLSNRNDANELNLTGSPLKDSCQFELLGESIEEIVPKTNSWHDDEEMFQSIAFHEAQCYLNAILQLREPNTPKLWAICDERASDQPTLLLSVQNSDGKCRRGILKFTGVTDFQPVNMAELQAKHLSYVVRQYGQIEGVVDSYYRVGSGGDAMLQVSHLVNGSMPQSILADGKGAAKMVLHQTISVNNFKSSAHKFWIQLGILDSIKETIVAYKETRDPSKLMFNSFNSSEITDIKKEIFDMLTQPIPIGIVDEDEMNNLHPNTNIDQAIQISDRVSIELMDQLWDSLKGCSSYNALKEAIDHLFTSAAKINVVNMPSSQSRLAHLIRDVSDHRLAIPRLTGSEPLELLLEIGLEKVNKDYEFIFINSKLCTAEELRADKKSVLGNEDLNVRKSLKTQFMSNGGGGPPRKTLMHKMSENMELNDSKEIGFQNSQFNLKTIEKDLARLGRIHLILEHLITIKTNLNLENVFTTFLEDLRKPLVPFNTLKETSTDFRSIPITNTKNLTKIEHIPHRQRVFFKSRNQYKIIRNTFYFSTDPIFPPHVFKCIENNETKLDMYYSHQYLEIENA